MQPIGGGRVPTLTARQLWLAATVYLLFFSSLWSIVGMELAVLTLHGVVLYHRLRTPVQDWLPWWVWLPFVLLTAWAMLASFAAEDAGASLARLPRHYRLFVPLLLLPALAQVDLRRLIGMHAGVACLLALYGVAQYGWAVDLYRGQMVNPYHASGTFDMYHTYAGIMLMAAPIYLSLAGSTQGYRRALWVGASGMAVLAVAISLGRAGWLGLAAALLVLCLRLPRPHAVLLFGLGTSVVAIVAAVVMTGTLQTVLGEADGNTVTGRLLSFERAESDERLWLWEAALIGIRDAPVLGHGLAMETVYPYLDRIRTKYGLSLSQLGGRNPHNTYLELAFALGIPGLLLFLAIWAAVIWWCVLWLRRAGTQLTFERSLLWGIIAALIGSLVNGFFGSHWVDAEVQVNILMWMGVALHIGIVVRRKLAQGPA
jgi:O-antigen ligase